MSETDLFDCKAYSYSFIARFSFIMLSTCSLVKARERRRRFSCLSMYSWLASSSYEPFFVSLRISRR